MAAGYLLTVTLPKLEGAGLAPVSAPVEKWVRSNNYGAFPCLVFIKPRFAFSSTNGGQTCHARCLLVPGKPFYSSQPF